MLHPRYAIYFVPAQDSTVYSFGAEMLGYDAFSGEACEQPRDLLRQFPDWPALTEEPRKYGFHATLKAPFPLAPTAREDDLAEAVENFTARGIPAITPVVDLIGDFVAIVPAQPVATLSDLANDCVTQFERFRAPLTEAERARRLRAKLTPRQISHVDRFGYPYVFEDFRFHMTLTGKIPPHRQDDILFSLRERFGGLSLDVIVIDTVALLRQDSADARFTIIACNQIQSAIIRS